jgi:hypothetical protein
MAAGHSLAFLYESSNYWQMGSMDFQALPR